VNFLLHRYLAARDLGSAAAGIGAMLPDLWRMADRRVRPALGPVAKGDEAGLLGDVLAGIEHHLAGDRWFHAAAPFLDGERLTAERLGDAQLEAPKIGLFAHVAWELCLDGALIRREGLGATLSALRRGFAAVRGEPASAAAALHHFDRVGRGPGEQAAFDTALYRLFEEIARGPWISGYQSGRGVAHRVDGLRGRLGFPRLSGADRERLGTALERLSPEADLKLLAILSSRRA
jgi:hypothetical protein